MYFNHIPKTPKQREKMKFKQLTQKQPFADTFQNMSSEKFCNIHWKTPAPE